MIKKFLHLLCFLVSGIIWSSLLIFLMRKLFEYLYALDIFSLQTYQIFYNFWEEGGVLGTKELIYLSAVILSVVLCIIGWYRLYHFKFMKLLTVPLNWLANRNLNNYHGMPTTNIKNLKIEEKKTIDQVVQERLVQERKKDESQRSKNNFRAEIIEKIEQQKEEI